MKKRILAACLVLGAGAAFILVGISRGEAALVLNKAVRICLECVGLK